MNATVGFGTAGLGHLTYDVVTYALQSGFRVFDTAEAEWWYDQANVGRAIFDFVTSSCASDDEDYRLCAQEFEELCDSLYVSTKIPPWELTSAEHIVENAQQSQEQLLGACGDRPLDIYYIHAPRCWAGWHPKCDNPPPTLNLYDAWIGMEQVVQNGSASRIGLSNIHEPELRALLQWIESRRATDPNARFPDALQIYSDPLAPNFAMQRVCQEYGMEFVSYSTLGTQHRQAQTNPVLTHDTVVKLSRKHQRSTAEVVLSWALHRDWSVIPRSSQRQHIDEIARLLTTPSFLDPSDVQAMDRLAETRTN